MRRRSAGFIQERGVALAAQRSPHCRRTARRIFVHATHEQGISPSALWPPQSIYESQNGTTEFGSEVRFVRPGDTVCARFQFLAEMSGKLNEDQGDNHQREESSEFVGAHNRPEEQPGHKPERADEPRAEGPFGFSEV